MQSQNRSLLNDDPHGGDGGRVPGKSASQRSRLKDRRQQVGIALHPERHLPGDQGLTGVTIHAPRDTDHPHHTIHDAPIPLLGSSSTRPPVQNISHAGNGNLSTWQEVQVRSQSPSDSPSSQLLVGQSQSGNAVAGFRGVNVAQTSGFIQDFSGNIFSGAGGNIEGTTSGGNAGNGGNIGSHNQNIAVNLYIGENPTSTPTQQSTGSAAPPSRFAQMTFLCGLLRELASCFSTRSRAGGGDDRGVGEGVTRDGVRPQSITINVYIGDNQAPAPVQD